MEDEDYEIGSYRKKVCNVCFSVRLLFINLFFFSVMARFGSITDICLKDKYQ